MRPSVERAIRTFGQVSFIEAIIQLSVAFGLPLNNVQHGAIVVVAGFVVTFLQNEAEDSGKVPALLK